jgi:hypothetical protein
MTPDVLVLVWKVYVLQLEGVELHVHGVAACQPKREGG